MIHALLSAVACLVVVGCGASPQTPAAPPAGQPSTSVIVPETVPAPEPPAEIIESVRLSRESGSAQDYFGGALALSAGRLVVGCTGDDTAGKDAGAVYIYAADKAGQWRLQATLLGKENKHRGFHGRFGCSVALEKDIVAVGAEWERPHSGAVYIYEPNAAGEWETTARLVSEPDFAEQCFGCKVALSGDLLLVGANQQASLHRDAGAAFLFRRKERGRWEQIAKLTSDDLARGDQFGATVAISGRTAVVGSRHNDDNTGSVYVFQEDANGAWRQVAKLKSDKPRSIAQFGISVAVDRDTVVVGEWNNSDKASDAGAAYVFRRDDQGNWQLQQKLSADDAAENDHFGYSVAIRGERILVGMLRHWDGPRLAGAYLFSPHQGGRWIQTAKFRSSDAKPIASFGSVVVLGEHHELIGDESQQEFRGAAYLFKAEPPKAE